MTELDLFVVWLRGTAWNWSGDRIRLRFTPALALRRTDHHRVHSRAKTSPRPTSTNRPSGREGNPGASGTRPRPRESWATGLPIPA